MNRLYNTWSTVSYRQVGRRGANRRTV